MAQYTLTIKQIIENNVDIFNFDYPLFDESYREVFQKKFIDHFYFREIGFETVGRFIFHLREQLNLIMPYYNKIYLSQAIKQNITDNYDITETYNRVTLGRTEVEGEVNNKNLYSDTPKKKIDIETNDFITSITKDSSTNENLVTDEGSDKWTRTMKGNIGVQTHADLVMKYEQSLRNVDQEIFDKLEILFMGVF